jgi:type VI secretion system protein ImpL
MAKLKAFLTNWWTVTLAILVLLLLLFCWGLPLFVGFLRPWWMRLLVFAALAGGWAILVYLRLRKARKAATALAEGIGGAADAGEEQVQAQRMVDAIRDLKQANGNRRDYLYSRPWYVIIGPPGSGKTTALLNSGLRFPFSNQALKGVGGTRNLDFWFADEAVLIDTAGRYTSQDSDATADGKAWKNFLTLLKRQRPLQPVNGILVAIGVDELLQGDRHAIDAHAAAIRRRLAEVRGSLEFTAPVYLLVTKADLLAGFVEYFDDLDVEGRRAVLGHSFAYADGRPTADGLAVAFDEVAQAISDRQAKRLAEEPDARRRSLILGFPAQMTALRSRLIRLLDGAFAAGAEPSGILRGIYFTSGIQSGAPLDRLLSGMAEIYDQQHTPAQSGGRAYFLNRLLTEVMFPEAGLVQMDPDARLRMRSRLVFAIGAIALVSLVVLGLWAVSFHRNQQLQQALFTQAQAAEAALNTHGVDMIQVSANDADLEQALPVLDQLRALEQGYGDRKAEGTPWSMGFGLFQSGHSEKAVMTYREALRRILLPRLLLRLETAMNADIASPLAVYDPLKVYLMLGGQKPGRIDAATVRSWVTSDWANASYPGGDRANLRKSLTRHLDALLEDQDMATVWPNRHAPLDGNIITAARTAIQTMSVADRAYAILRQKALAQGGAAWTANTKISSGDEPAFANGAVVRQLRVPFFFTRIGYEKSYQAGLLTVQKDLTDDLWLLGGDADTAIIQQQMGSVRPGVAALYAKDYIAAWSEVVGAMKPASYFSDLAAFGSFTKSPSPWKLLLLEIRRNTTFSGGAVAAQSMLAEGLKSRLGTAGQLLPAEAGSIDAGHEIASYFRPINDYVGNGKDPAGIDDFLTAVKTAGQAVIAARSAGSGAAGDAVQAQMATATAAVQAAGAGAPADLQGFVAETAADGSSAQSSAIQGAVAQAYTTMIMPMCRSVVQDRYPFFATAIQDASVADTIRFFGNGGTMDNFVRDRVTPLVDMTGPVWRWRLDDSVAAALDPASAGEFAMTPVIRDLLTAGLSFRVALDSLGAGADAAEFSSGNATYRFDKAGGPPRPMQWAPTGGTPEAHITLFKQAQQVDQIAEQGPWAVFRLVDKARKQNSGETAFLATFGSGDNSVTFRIMLDTDKNPFSRGGLWAFRCPIAL